MKTKDDVLALTGEALEPAERSGVYEQMTAGMQEKMRYFLGYQVNQDLSYSEELHPFLGMHLNNIGDPFTDGNMTMHSKEMERAVLDYYASLWHAETPHANENGNSYWGYTLSMGSTEGNVYAIWNARDYLSGKLLLSQEDAEAEADRASRSGKPARAAGLQYSQADERLENPNAYRPVAFFSQDTHYSIVKAMRVLAFDTFYSLGTQLGSCPLSYPADYPDGFSKEYIGERGWPREVPSDLDGAVYVPALKKLVEYFLAEGHPIFVCFNYGTTFKGAYDPVESAVEALSPLLEAYGMLERTIVYEKNGQKYTDVRSGFWFHVDGALGAGHMPYVEKAAARGLLPEQEVPVFDFRLPEIQSICMSGHKALGAPFPCGVYMTKTKYQLLPPDDPMYIGAPDTTFAGSRSSLAAMYMWDQLARMSEDDHVAQAVHMQKMAAYAAAVLTKVAEDICYDLWVEHTSLSLTVRFRRPHPDIVDTYSLSCEALYVDGEKRHYAHLFAMKHVSRELLDTLAEDLRQEGAFPCRETKHQGPGPAADTLLSGRSFK
ncbi:pyridoxal-dependent decarboxylase [Alkalicoccus chagannorensis]|uniref:pyridoxal-dependent decarboxylase n=1 Tax=Alkalicoccus chagannorensis TaxID=427072 RepID=UPI00068776CE|nr:pyridoxal-dependent decarboxylase [Alkalicoccus chagannorensis]